VFFLPIDYGLLDGNEIESVAVFSDSSFWFSLLLLLIAFICAIKLPELLNNFIIVSGIIGLLFSVYLFIGTDDNTIRENHDAHSRFSSSRNVIVMSFDSLQGDFLETVFTENEELRNQFDGFTFYDDVISYAPNTTFSLLSTLTGKYVPVGRDGDLRETLFIANRNSSLPAILAKNNFQGDTFNVPHNLSKDAVFNNATTVLPENISDNYKLTASDIQYLKIFPKSFSLKLLEGFSINFNNTENETDEITIIKNDKLGHGYGIEKYVFKKMLDDFHLVPEPVFKFHHYLHTHQPIRFDHNYNYDPGTSENLDSAKTEMVGAMGQLAKLISKLKDLEIYDDSLLIITSDHGYEYNIQPDQYQGKEYFGGMINRNGAWSASRYWTTLMIKSLGDKGNMKFSSRPVELVDIMPTILHSQGLEEFVSESLDGVNLFADQNKSERKAMLYVGGTENEKNKHYDSRLFQQTTIHGNRYNGIKEAMHTISLGKTYLECNTVTEFSQEPSQYTVSGMLGIEPWGRWSNSKRASITFYFSDSECNPATLTLNLNAFLPPTHPVFRAEAVLNGRPIGNVEIKHGEKVPRDFIYDLPNGILDFDKLNTLEFHMENPPISPKSVGLSEDIRQLGLGFRSMHFK